mgnify:CR=1 FL=1
MADVWKPESLMYSKYIWLPIGFDDTGKPVIEWKEVGILADIFEKKGKELAPLSRQAPFLWINLSGLIVESLDFT